MAKEVSKQRALIALRSFPTLAAAARSVGVDPRILMRMAAADADVQAAYKFCLEGVVRAKQAEERREAERARKAAEPPVVTERVAERRKARFFAAVGADPKLAAAALHKRLNRERRQEKAAELEEAIDAVNELIAGRHLVPTKRVLDVIDRWCGRCQCERVDDPCEVCGCKTIQHK